jgi:YVTN family beta-propeller protein
LHKRTKIVSVFLLWILLLCAEAFAAESGRLAYVPNEGDNNLMVVDLNAERVIKTLPTGKKPHALAFTKQGKCYVNNRGTKDLTVIDANRFEVIKTIPLPAISFQLAVSPDGKTLAVTYKDVLKVSFINTGSDAIVRTVAIGKEPDGVFKGAMMKHPYWSRDGKFVYAADNVNDAMVKIDAATGDIKASIALPGTNHYVHPSRDGKLLYAVNETTRGGGTSITLIDSQTDKVVKDIPVPLEPGERGLGHHGEFSRDGRYFFFCNMGGSTVAVMDVAKREIVKAIKVGKGPGHPCLTRNGTFMFIIHHRDNVLTVIDVAREEVIKDIPVGKGEKQAHACYFTPDGKYFYMLNAQDGMMNKIDVSRMEVVSKIAVGKSAMSFGIKEGEEFPGTE